MIKNYMFWGVPVLSGVLFWVSLPHKSHRAYAHIQEGNHVPEVQWISPQAGAYTQDKKMSYKVRVSDQEDGDSKYDEIANNEVLVQLRYVPEGASATKPELPEGLASIMGSNCINCHDFNSTLIGPSFRKIAKTYQGKNIMGTLVQRVRDGSVGVWGGTVMPSHKEISDAEIAKMVQWILLHAAEPLTRYTTGVEGPFALTLPAGDNGKGHFDFTAFYKDHGVDGKDARVGSASMELKVQ